MEILFLTQIIPFPPDAGPKVKTYHVLRALIGQGHAVTLVSFVRPEEREHIPFLRSLCKEVHVVPLQRSRLADLGYGMVSMIGNRSFLIERDNLPALQVLVDRLVREHAFDFIHADQLTMAQFALRGAAAAKGKKPRVIFDAHNAVWTIVERMQKNVPWFLKPVVKMEAMRIKRYEGKLMSSVDHVLAVTEIDKTYLQEAREYAEDSRDQAAAPTSVIPIAVDTQKLRPIHRKPGSKNIVTLGTLHYLPNADGIRWFMNEVFPLVRQSIPDATLTIIGKNPPRDFLEKEKQNPGAIKVTGYVPDLTPYFEQSALMAVPVRAGGGMRVRILEAFASGMPAITTSVGLEGIEAVRDLDVLVEDEPVNFARRICGLLNNPAQQELLARNGRHLAETRYDWQVVLSAMRRIYE